MRGATKSNHPATSNNSSIVLVGCFSNPAHNYDAVPQHLRRRATHPRWRQYLNPNNTPVLCPRSLDVRFHRCQGFAPTSVNFVRHGAMTTSATPAHQQHERARVRGRGTRPSEFSFSALAASSSSASQPSPANFLAGLFGGSTKGLGKRGSRAEALEAELLAAIDGVQGRGRCDRSVPVVASKGAYSCNSKHGVAERVEVSYSKRMACACPLALQDGHTWHHGSQSAVR